MPTFKCVDYCQWPIYAHVPSCPNNKKAQHKAAQLAQQKPKFSAQCEKCNGILTGDTAGLVNDQMRAHLETHFSTKYMMWSDVAQYFTFQDEVTTEVPELPKTLPTGTIYTEETLRILANCYGEEVLLAAMEKRLREHAENAAFLTDYKHHAASAALHIVKMIQLLNHS